MDPNNISHFTKTACVTHINYRLAGSIPEKVLKAYQREREEALVQLANQTTTPGLKNKERPVSGDTQRINASFELALDNYLHNASGGPMYLRRADVAEVVMNSLLHLHQQDDLFLYAA